MPLSPTSGITPCLPHTYLDEIHDCIANALDTTECTGCYSQAEGEAKAYLRSAIRQSCQLMAEQIGGAAS